MLPIFNTLNNTTLRLIKDYITFFILLILFLQPIHAYQDSALETINTERSVAPQQKKPWTVLVYMAADNDLYPFAYRNLAQMKQVGSNENINILIHFDTSHPGQPKVTKRLYIERDKVWQIGPDYVMDSGSDVTLVDSIQWALRDFPSEHFALVLWNHGSGDLNPVLRKTINPAQLFKYNSETHLIELDRSVGFIDFIEQSLCNNHLHADESAATTELSLSKRGVCFDETYGTYLDDAKLMRAFAKIIKERNDKKIDLIIFDACLMAGTGTTYMMAQFADYMVASEEVVLGAGYDYQLMLRKIAMNASVTPEEFAKSIVHNYEITYGNQTNDYTNSAFKLEKFAALDANINLVAQLLIEALKNEKNHSVKQLIKKCRSRSQCTFFDEPSYIDLGNFYENLLKNIHQLQLVNQNNTPDTIQALTRTLQEGIILIHRLVIANVVGKNLAGARGISIHFPEVYMENPSFQSYYVTEFARNNSWAQFLKQYFNR